MQANTALRRIHGGARRALVPAPTAGTDTVSVARDAADGGLPPAACTDRDGAAARTKARQQPPCRGRADADLVRLR